MVHGHLCLPRGLQPTGQTAGPWRPAARQPVADSRAAYRCSGTRTESLLTALVDNSASSRRRSNLCSAQIAPCPTSTRLSTWLPRVVEATPARDAGGMGRSPQRTGKAVSAAPEGRVGVVVVMGRLPRLTRTADAGTPGLPGSQALGESPAHSQLSAPCPLPSGIRRPRAAGASSRARPKGCGQLGVGGASAASCAAFSTSTSSRSRCRGSPWRASARSLAVLMMLSSPRPPTVPRLHCQWVEQRIPNEVATRCLSTNRS
jgi:hypothetical protein